MSKGGGDVLPGPGGSKNPGSGVLHMQKSKRDEMKAWMSVSDTESASEGQSLDMFLVGSRRQIW